MKKQTIEQVIADHTKMVQARCRRFRHDIPSYENEDLEQECWANIIGAYGEYDPLRDNMVTWINKLISSTLYTLLYASHADKRAVENFLVSLQSGVELGEEE